MREWGFGVPWTRGDTASALQLYAGPLLEGVYVTRGYRSRTPD
jgi:hypothetical protein